MWRNHHSAQRRRIHDFAVAWAKADMGPGYHAHGGMARGVRVFVISAYAANRLAPYGEMTTGVHRCKAVRRLDFCTRPPVLTVDFTRCGACPVAIA